MAKSKLFTKRKPPSGSVPGTLSIDDSSPFPVMKLITFNEKEMEEITVEDPSLLEKHIFEKGRVNWIDVQGLGDEKTLRRLGEIFKLHPLALEDITNVPQIPKVEEYENGLFICLRMIRLEEKEVISEQVSFFVGETFVLTFQERYGDVFDPVRQRMRRGSTIRKLGNDFTVYALIDTIIDNYFPVLQETGSSLEALEDEMILKINKEKLQKLYELKHGLAELKRILWPTRDAIGQLARNENRYIDGKTALYFRDVYDHVIQSIDMLDLYRELASELMNVYLSSMSNRMNEIMKVLTIISTIFIPLSFVAGVYGMNFRFMPELELKWAYPIVLGAMVAIAGAMLYFFHKKGWFRKD